MRSTPPSTPWHRIGPLAVLVAALHVAVLTMPAHSARPIGAAPGPAQLQVRVVPVPPRASTPVVSLAILSTVANTASPSTVRTLEATSLVADVATAIESAPALAIEAQAPLEPLFGIAMPGIESDDDYFPRSALSRAPWPVDTVLIDYPSLEKDAGYYRGELTLFIDERGHVARVRVEGELPPMLETAARNAFLSGRFQAGELDGRAVKSRIRIEVVFDSGQVGA